MKVLDVKMEQSKNENTEWMIVAKAHMLKQKLHCKQINLTLNSVNEASSKSQLKDLSTRLDTCIAASFETFDEIVTRIC